MSIKKNCLFIFAIVFISVLARAGGAAPICFELFANAAYQKPSASTLSTANRYLQATLSGLEKMRGPRGFLSDAIWIQNHNDGTYKIETLNAATSPTNIAVDLLIQTELLNKPETRAQALKKLRQVIDTLSSVEYHGETGLFFSRYSSDSVTPTIKDPCVSSIDNLHLAIALWTIKEMASRSDIGIKAAQLFSRMDFSTYYDSISGLIGGNLRPDGKGGWIKESYNFANVGSEARLLYSAGWAIGLFRNVKNDSVYLQKAFKGLKMEFHQSPEGRLLKLWDGSSFQLYFPRIFANENLYSSSLSEMYSNAGNYIVAEGKRRNISTPAAHSAIRVGTHEDIYKGEGTIYRDKGGNIDLVSTANQDVNDPVLRNVWQGAFAPYALMMAAAGLPETLIPIAKTLEPMKSGNDSLYISTLGWMEGAHVQGAQKNEVVAAQLSLNQGMGALSLLQIVSPDGLSASARALNKNVNTRARLQQFYAMFDVKAASIP